MGGNEEGGQKEERSPRPSRKDRRGKDLTQGKGGKNLTRPFPPQERFSAKRKQVG